MEEERIALFLDYENLAIGAREHLGVQPFDIKPISDALAERGRVVVRRAYADWSYFQEDRRTLTRHHVELIDMPQKMGGARKNAADIKLAVDAMELSFSAPYVTTFIIATGDSDFTPLMHKLRERNKSVIGIGVEGSTSDLLPPACDEFLFYDRLEGVVASPKRERRRRGPQQPAGTPQPDAQVPDAPQRRRPRDEDELTRLITQTVSGLKRSGSDTVLASHLKRTLLRKDPTFDEAEYGFRSFGELLRHLSSLKVVELAQGSAKGDPEVDLPAGVSGEDEAFQILNSVVAELTGQSGAPPLSGLKNELRKRKPGFSEKRFGYGGFLQFCKAAKAKGLVDMVWDDDADDYLLRPVAATRS